MRRFEGRSIIVTGGSSGIGRAIAHRLAGEGASLVLVAAPDHAEALDAEVSALAGQGTEAVGLAADVGEEATAQRAVELALERHGRIDGLANNAGIAYFEPALE